MGMYETGFSRVVAGGPLELANVNSKSTNQWFGRTAITSATGGLGKTVTCPLLDSDSLLSITYEVTSAAGIPPFQLAVRTRTAGTSFEIGHANSFSYNGSYSVTANWQLTNAASIAG